MGLRAGRARGGRDEEGRRGAASKDVPRNPRHLPVDFLAERMLAVPLTCGDTARSALQPDLLARRRLKGCPSRWLCLSAAWSFVQVFSEPDGFTVIFSGLGNNAGGTMHWNDTRPAHFRILKVVLKEALAECLMDSYSLDVHGGRRTAAGCEG
nr:unnamed protein product [Pongo abelii]